MAKCPYTWFKNLISFSSSNKGPNEEADHLHVRVIKNGEETVRVSLPARSARWLIEVIPDDVVLKIKEEKIPLEEILDDLKSKTILRPQPIFSLIESHRTVQVWLE